MRMNGKLLSGFALSLAIFLVVPSSQAADAKVDALNQLNVNLKKVATDNPDPTKDGKHDVSNEGTFVLQAPKEAFVSFVKSDFGNRVDWVQTLHSGKINPRADRLNPEAELNTVDFNIHRPVKGFMPDVIFPHKQHTEWLKCQNCHDSIFIPQKGANKISMSDILQGKKCGVCHGKVAFPVKTSTCKKCHSQKKDTAALLKKLSAQ
ncbi:MAG: cytochrome c3 family protein [Mariprofundaceae bacterium]